MTTTLIIELTPFQEDDYRKLVSWIRSPEELFLWSADTFTYPLDETQLEAHRQKLKESDTRLMYSAVERKTGDLVGHIELARIDRETRKASIAYVLVDPDKRGLGFGKAMLHEMLDHCFDGMKLSRVDLFVFEYNTVAIRCYQSLGFEIEDVIYDRVKFNGGFVPLCLMGISFERWNASKK